MGGSSAAGKLLRLYLYMPVVSLAQAHAPFILVLDMGTSSLRAMVYDAGGSGIRELVARARYQAEVSNDGGSTLDPEAMFEAFGRVLDEIVARSQDLPIAAVASSSLAYNLLALNSRSEPLTPAFLYSDTRNVGTVSRLGAAYEWAPIYARTGCPLHTSYAPARLLWLRETQPAVFAQAASWVSLHEYLLLRLFGRAVVSHSFASWSGMFNHVTLDWDPEVLGLAGIGRAQLSPLVSVNTGMTGLCRELGARWESLAQIPWYPALGDGAVANLGSGCVDETQVAVTVGTSGAMRVVMPAAEGLQKLPPGLWMYRVDEADGLVGGSLNNGGNVLSYLSQVLQVPASAMRERELAALQPDAHGLTILPFFAGERSPGYRGEARAAITGLSFSTTPTELWRAALEAIAYRFAAIYDRLRLAIPKPRQIVASGAALLHSPVWVQLIADTLGVPVTASGEDEASARGAALLALRALHIVSSLSALPGALGETCFPDPVHFEIYRRARERQELLYHLLLDNAVKI